jgi:fused signal recognition particle receptor
MFGFFRRNKPAPAQPPGPSSDTPPESSTAAALITAAASESDIAASEAAAIGSQAAITDIAEAVPQAPSDRRPWLARLKQGLSRTRGNIAVLFTGVRIDEALYEDLETALLSGDTGVETTQWLLTALREKVRKDKLTETAQVKAALRGLLVGLLAPAHSGWLRLLGTTPGRGPAAGPGQGPRPRARRAAAVPIMPSARPARPASDSASASEPDSVTG